MKNIEYLSLDTDPPVYINPVYSNQCPDPFVLKYLNEYWCYCTGLWRDGRCFGVLHSRDLIHWRELGGAMEPPDKNASCYWSPEVCYENGLFLLYYSMGNGERMRIGVARALHPAGPFIDCGVRLTDEEFAIDPHVFKDDDGTRWMFYATDFLSHTHIGTGTVCDRMLDAFTLSGEPQPVTRACYDLQIDDPHQIEKDGLRWQTVEGPFVLKRRGRYYQMFSGGNWKNETYGVSYAVSEKISSSNEWRPMADGEQILPLVRTVPGEVIGPGHNSVVRGPDNQQLFGIYHCWHRQSETFNDRVLAVDRLEWVGEKMLVIGPSFTPQPAPILSTFADYFDSDRSDGLGAGWACSGGQWRVREGAAWQEEVEGEAEAACTVEAPYFVTEVSVRMKREPINGGGAGVKLVGEQGALLFMTLIPDAGQVVLTIQAGEQWRHHNLVLPAGFDFAAFHLLRIEVNGLRVKIVIDGTALKWEGVLGSQPHGIALITQNKAAEFAGFALTIGWEDLFGGDQIDPAELNWTTTANDDRWRIDNRHLCYLGPSGEGSILTKGPLPDEYELVINARLVGEPRPAKPAKPTAKPTGCYGFLPALGVKGDSPLLTVEHTESGWAVCCDTAAGRELFPLPADFDHQAYQQFRFRRRRERLTIQHEGRTLGEIASSGEANMVGLYGCRAVAAFEMVRVTALSSEESFQ